MEAKLHYQQGIEAARLAKLTGKPVMVAWTRDEEFFYDNFHSAGVVKINSGIDKSGMIKFWDYHVWYSGTRGADTIYDVPNAKTTSYSQGKNAPAGSSLQYRTMACSKQQYKYFCP